MVKNIIVSVIAVAAIVACPILYYAVGPQLTQLQTDIAIVLLIITASAAAYCFIVGEITLNNSQMDKLWSILPIAYVWVMAAMGGMTPRLIIMAILATLWGIRLTINFGRKGAYSIKFWTGEEDYRWKVLRKTKYFKSRLVWAAFDLFFISVYQNLLVLIITFPMLASVGSEKPLNWIDFVAMGLTFGALLLETVADEQQRIFQDKKWGMINEGKKLEELPEPYSKGFNTTGLWNYSRHPNYLGEQLFWICFYIFSIGAGVGVFNWSFMGAAFLVLLFVGSSTMGEAISGGKYPEYAEYKKKVSRFIPLPWRPYEKKEKEQDAA
ncbi:MAG: DUF1295 domain-containing protein [Bacilli bacterium]|nr:DUF1295 domain-containing protein [Bacilli bacterium]